jgi:hypothetical protein
MNQLSLFGERDRDGEENFSLPTPSDADPPLLKAKREQAAREAGAHLREMVAKWAP